MNQKYIVKKLIEYIPEERFLNLCKYNKSLQNKFQLSIDDYKNYTQIEIEVIPVDYFFTKFVNNKFINIVEDKSLYHIYLNDFTEEIARNYIIKDDDYVTKIKIKLDIGITALKDLFKECKYIKEIKFTNFKRKNILDMSHLFNGCSSLIKLDIPNIITNNVTDMSGMFSGCYSLKSLPDLSKWNTSNVKNMRTMFYYCGALFSLPDISKWNTNNVTDMSYMFFECQYLSSLPDISKWNTNNVTDMTYMFFGCKFLKNIPAIFTENTKKCSSPLNAGE